MRRHVLPDLVSLGLVCASIAGEPAKTTLSVSGLSCDGCAAAFAHQLGKTDGVMAYDVDVAKDAAEVTYEPDKTDAGTIGQSLLKRGFTVRLSPSEPADAAFFGCSNGFCGSRRPDAPVTAQPGAVPGDQVYCPVSAVVLRTKESTLEAEVNGRPV